MPTTYPATLSITNIHEEELITKLLDRLQTELDGLKISVECEEIVIAHLMQYRTIWNEDKDNKTPILTRYIFQLLDSEKLVREWKQKIEDLEKLIEQQTPEVR